MYNVSVVFAYYAYEDVCWDISHFTSCLLLNLGSGDHFKFHELKVILKSVCFKQLTGNWLVEPYNVY